MAYCNNLTAEHVRQVLSYDPDSGVFIWRHNPRSTGRFNAVCAGRPAGTIATTGYLKIKIGGQAYCAHRLAWLYMTGEWPENEIDHADRDKLNNRFSNLREADKAQNAWNRTKNSRNKSGYKNVCWVKKKKRWLAKRVVNGKVIRLGMFRTIDEAVASLRATASAHCGDFARTE